MARYKHIDTGMRLLPVDLSVQLLPGSFEHALSHLLDHELELRRMDARFKNDEGGAPAYAPRVLLKVTVFANIRHNKGLDRFTLRGRRKVDTQWKLYCLVHNIEKLAHYGYWQ